MKHELDISAPSTYMMCDFDLLPYFLVGDEIFSLKTRLRRPYAGELKKSNEFPVIVYTYHLHYRLPRTIENVFGILCTYCRMSCTQ